VKIGKSTSELLAPLTMAYGEYAMKKSSTLEGHTWFKEGGEDMQDDPRSGQPKMQRTYTNVDKVQTLLHSDRRLGVRLIAEVGNENLFEGKDPNSGITSGFTMTIHLPIICEEFARSWLRNP
jgi:hypothetical protein